MTQHVYIPNISQERRPQNLITFNPFFNYGPRLFNPLELNTLNSRYKCGTNNIMLHNSAISPHLNVLVNQQIVIFAKVVVPYPNSSLASSHWTPIACSRTPLPLEFINCHACLSHYDAIHSK